VHSVDAVLQAGECRCDTGCHSERINIDHWAAEIEFLMTHLGPAHVALGTDGGGRLPKRVYGFSDMRDLGILANAMAAHGISSSDIYAYMGGNIYNLLSQVLN
jgi:microsomal dipeptidase-like Zn-dependent dipeptidase